MTIQWALAADGGSGNTLGVLGMLPTAIEAALPVAGVVLAIGLCWAMFKRLSR